jgi:Major intrinsic protein
VVRRAATEALGTAFLLMAVVGSGIMGERLAAGNFALALLANAVATGAALVPLILTLGLISGAHFNPAVTLAAAVEGGISWREVPAYLGAQMMGGLRRSRSGALDVWLAAVLCVPACAERARPVMARVRRKFRTAVGDFGMLAHASFCCPVGGRDLHHRGILVYSIHVVCQSGSHGGSCRQRHFCRDTTHRCARIRRFTIRRCSRCNVAGALADASE